MQDIADRLGIAKVSVSKALNRKAGISDGLRQTVFSTAREMGYELIPAEEPKRFAFVVSKHFFLETDAFYSEMYYQFNKQCLETGISTALIIVGNGDLARNVLPPQMQMEEFNGVAVAGEMPDDFLRLLEKPGRPLVLMDFESNAVSACSLLTGNYHWASVITQLMGVFPARGDPPGPSKRALIVCVFFPFRADLRAFIQQSGARILPVQQNPII